MMTICPLCNKNFKLLTANHITHKHHQKVVDLKYSDPHTYNIVFKDMQKLHQLGTINRKKAWKKLVKNNRIVRKCTNCQKEIICRKNDSRKFCNSKCTKQYFIKNKIGIFNYNARSRGAINNISNQKRLNLGFFNSNFHKQNHEYLKKHKLSIYRPGIQSKAGKIGGKVTQSRYNCQKWLHTPTARANLTASMKLLWANPKFKEDRLKKMLSSLKNRPTTLEKKIILFIKENNLEFKYTGDGKVLINYKNPDFIDLKRKLIIEVFYEYFKIKTYGSIKNYARLRSKQYYNKKYRTIFITDQFTRRPGWEPILLNNVINIIKDKNIKYLLLDRLNKNNILSFKTSRGYVSFKKERDK